MWAPSVAQSTSLTIATQHWLELSQQQRLSYPDRGRDQTGLSLGMDPPIGTESLDSGPFSGLEDKAGPLHSEMTEIRLQNQGAVFYFYSNTCCHYTLSSMWGFPEMLFMRLCGQTPFQEAPEFPTL